MTRKSFSVIYPFVDENLPFSTHRRFKGGETGIDSLGSGFLWGWLSDDPVEVKAMGKPPSR